jgi:hypothetical protein
MFNEVSVEMFDEREVLARLGFDVSRMLDEEVRALYVREMSGRLTAIKTAASTAAETCDRLAASLGQFDSVLRSVL